LAAIGIDELEFMKAVNALDTAQNKLPPDDVCLKRMVGMADYTRS
jgi:hypothetical protein